MIEGNPGFNRYEEESFEEYGYRKGNLEDGDTDVNAVSGTEDSLVEGE